MPSAIKPTKTKKKPRPKKEETKDDEDVRKCKELLKSKKKKPETRAQKIKKAANEINTEYKKIQKNLIDLDDIKEVVNAIKEDIEDELSATPSQKVYDELTGEISDPVRSGIHKPDKYTPEVKKSLVKSVIAEMNVSDAQINKSRDFDEFEKEEIKDMQRKSLLVEVNNNKDMPEMVKLEVLEVLNKVVLERNRELPKMIEQSGITDLITLKIFDDFEINKVFNARIYDSTINSDVYKEHNRFIKDILTTFVNAEMLTTNDHQILLMSVVYKNMNPWLKKTGSKLIFYGGNLMRQIHRNINEYFDPDSQEVFEKFFGEFVKKSDNDFSLMLGTNPLQMGDVNDPDIVRKYDDYHNKCFVEVSYILGKIRDEIMSDLYSHFSFFKYSPEYKKTEYTKLKLYLQEAASKLDSRIKIDDVKITNRHDQLLLYPDNAAPLPTKNKINLYKNTENNVIFNSYNNALHFRTPEVGHFSLLRSKINFTIDGTFVSKNDEVYKLKHDYGGELIDFGIPYLMDDGAFSHHGKKYKENKKDGGEWLKKWLNRKVEIIKNEKYDFEYMLYGNRYQVELLFHILFWVPGRPWLAQKYDKRVARSILFEFYYLIDQYPVGLKALKEIKEIFRNMSSEMLQRIVKETDLACDSIETEEDRINYNAWMHTLEVYVSKIIKGIDSLIDYFNGKKKIPKKNLFKLNIV